MTTKTKYLGTMTTRRKTMTNKDSLIQMFNKQKEFQKLLTGIELPKVNYTQLNYTMTALIAELGEVLQADKNWKNWKRTKDLNVDRDALLDEVVDVFHFVINMALYLGYDAQDVIKKFDEKNAVNFERQNNNY